jgi:hypothetical protein
MPIRLKSRKLRHAIFLSAILVFILLFVCWQSLTAPDRNKRNQFDSLRVGMTEAEVSKIINGGYLATIGPNSEADLQAHCKASQDFNDVLPNPPPFIPHSTIYVVFKDGRLKYKAIWEPTIKDIWKRWVYLAERRRMQSASRRSGSRYPEFDPTRMIRIEFPGGYSQSLAIKMGGSDEMGYELKDNILEFRGNHYRLKIGDIARLETSGAVLINDNQAMSFEEIWKIASVPLTTKCPWICAMQVCCPRTEVLKELSAAKQ